MRLFVTILVSLCSFCSFSQSNKIHEFNLPFKNPYSNRDSMVYNVGDNLSLTYYKPKVTDIFVNFIRDMRDFGYVISRKESLPWIGAVGGSTALLVAFDRETLKGSQNLMNSIGIDGEKKCGDLKIGNTAIYEYPKNFNSFLYSIGEGMPSLLISAGFYIRGISSKDYRALQTANQLMEEFLSMGVTCQVIKHISGRQSPWRTTSGTGRWDVFPNQSEYMKNVSNYDAFPSGHMATLMCTTTILANNYPEYKLIRPIGYGIMAAVGLAMMNNEVHWLSDYPLAIGIGYVMGKVISQRGRKISFTNPTYSNIINNISVYPSYYNSNSFGVSLVYHLD